MEAVLWAVGVVAVCVVLSLAGMLQVRRSVAISTLEEQSDVAGFVYAVLGVVYAVLMAFIVTVVWDRFDRAETVVDQEANALVDLFRLAQSLPDSERLQIQQTLLAYTREVLDREWPLMARGQASVEAAAQIDILWQAYRRIEPSTNQASAVYQQSLEQLDELDDARAIRLLLTRSGLPRIMWAVLIVGAQITVGFSFLFGVRNLVAQAAMVATLTTTVALILFLIGALDYAFAGSVRVDPRAFETALVTMERVAAARP